MADRRMHPAEYQPDGPSQIADGLRFVTCSVCGQTVDMQSLGQVHHHDGKAHAPLQQRPRQVA